MNHLENLCDRLHKMPITDLSSDPKPLQAFCMAYASFSAMCSNITCRAHLRCPHPHSRQFTTAPNATHGSFAASVFGDWGFGTDGKAVATRQALEKIRTHVDLMRLVEDPSSKMTNSSAAIQKHYFMITPPAIAHIRCSCILRNN